MNPEPAEPHVVLVDTADRELGTMPKLQAHIEGALHRAVSVLVVDSEGRLLLQQRAWAKYHCAGLWANAACSPASARTRLTRSAT